MVLNAPRCISHSSIVKQISISSQPSNRAPTKKLPEMIHFREPSLIPTKQQSTVVDCSSLAFRLIDGVVDRFIIKLFL